ncbi:dihydroorotate dehydrogenase [Protofrankia symbiont of Coriaria ruscifolia]|uniref:dihydroorotate dehydrogenase n=1 Tax=Protofrankia symbiont of Coriaria ruscifolia TaxID=1306542 RepID=UPI0013EF8631|nr:dihydroorotate dehydrogenase [Protofrankia symbiont of Coriaria ruscifolia]
MTALCGVELEHPLMNAAGTCKSLDEVDVLARSAVSAVVVGSITAQARTGNGGNVYYPGDFFSLNALGLPNPGLAYYREHLPEMISITHAAGKPLVVSIAGFSEAEYAAAAYDVALAGADIIELNLACPNVWDGGTQKRIACFDNSQTETVCTQVSQALAAATPTGATAGEGRRPPPFGIKISPFSDPAGLAELASLVAKLSSTPQGPRFVCAVNTFPNALALDGTNRPVIDVELAGLAGAALKPVALGQIRQLRRLLPETVELIGAGGVSRGRDIADFLCAGAAAVQAATAFWNRNGDAGVFGDILTDYADLF